MNHIDLFYEGVDFHIQENPKLIPWLLSVVDQEKEELSFLNYIFCDDAYLLDINQQYLNHNTYTDIITFDHREAPGPIEGDIFISVERVRENAHSFQVSFEKELHRVMVHGLLHLLGYLDKSESEQKRMRAKEDHYLAQFSRPE